MSRNVLGVWLLSSHMGRDSVVRRLFIAGPPKYKGEALPLWLVVLSTGRQMKRAIGVIGENRPLLPVLYQNHVKHTVTTDIPKFQCDGVQIGIVTGERQRTDIDM